MVFQDPFASLNPRMRIGDILLEGMAALKVGPDLAARHARIDELLQRVGLDAAMRSRFRMNSPVASASASRSPARSRLRPG